MDKDAFYFPHFSNARHDRKIKRIQKDLGLEGYGIFFMLLEVLREQTDMRYPYSDIDLLADEFCTSVAKIEVVINNYDLFEIDIEKMFFSPRLLLYLQPYLTMKEQRRLAGQKSGESRRLKSMGKNERLFNGCSTDVQRLLNENEQRKVKESKVKESKVKVVNETDSAEAEKSATTAAVSNSDGGCFTCYNENIGLMSPHIAERIMALLDDGIEEDLIKRYIGVACERNIRNWAYIEKMAMGNAQNNIKTLEKYEANIVERNNKKLKQTISGKIPQHENFDQRSYDDVDLESFYQDVSGGDG